MQWNHLISGSNKCVENTTSGRLSVGQGAPRTVTKCPVPWTYMRSNLLEVPDPDLDYFTPHSPPIAIVVNDLVTEIIGHCEMYGNRECSLDCVDERRPGVFAQRDDRACRVQGGN